MTLLAPLKYSIVRVNRTLKILVLLWLINLAFGIILTVGVYQLLNESLSSNLMGDRLLQGFDHQWFVEFEFKHHDTLSRIPNAIIIFGVLYAVLQTFCSGGLLRIFHSQDKNPYTIDFFYGSVQYFWRFFKLFFLVVILFVGLYGVNQWLIQWIDVRTINMESEVTAIGRNLGRYIFIAVLFLFISVIFDYAKIKIVVHESYSLLPEVWSSVKFVFSHFGKTIGMYLPLIVVGVILFGIYFILESALPANRVRWILLVFLLQQFYIISRVWLRMLFLASQMDLYKTVSSVSIPMEIAEETVF